MMKNKIRFLVFLLILFGLFGGLSAHAALEIDLITSPETPVEPVGDENVIAAYIVRLYWFAVGAAGIVAVAVIVGGAIYYMVSSGSPDKQNDAKSYITSALWGVALLLGSYLILNTVNPQITKLGPPGGALPNCPPGGGSPGIDCLPVPPQTLPVCTDEDDKPGENCLPDCTKLASGKRACGIGENPQENECVQCTYPIQRCPDAVVSQCKTTITYKTGEVEIPLCKFGRSKETGLLLGNCSEVIIKSSSAGGTNPNLSDGAYVQHTYYPSETGPEAAECLIDYYKKNVDDKGWEKPNLRGLTAC